MTYQRMLKPVLKARTWTLTEKGMNDGYERCRVPGCMVWSKALINGMCPPAIWDEMHDRYAENMV